MLTYYNIFFLLFCGFISKCLSDDQWSGGMLITTKSFMFWPNATVPFYINPDHFDQEQAISILTSLSKFAFKTCIKFAPVMTAPTEGQHVMTFVNPKGVRRCRIENKGHSNYNPHIIDLGYECLKSPEIDMVIMRALGLPFEHNRMSRDVYIDIMVENIEPSYIELFTKDGILPPSLRSLAYDHNSVMHFGERDYSKNGHRTIIFKQRNLRQNRNGLTPTDVKKIELVYGPECRNRDRAEKYAICQSYPGVSRRKREILAPLANMSLRVNPNITPPPAVLAGLTEGASTRKPQKVEDNTAEAVGSENSLSILGINKEADIMLDLVYQISVLALQNAREKYCNITNNTTSEFQFYYEQAENKTSETSNASDVLGILKIITDFAKSIIDDAVNNLTVFCENSNTIEDYQKQCKSENDGRCPKTYSSTKSGAVRLSDAHKLVGEETKLDAKAIVNDVNTNTTLKANRRKREASTTSRPTKEIKMIKVHKDEDTTEEDEKEDNLKQKLKKERLFESPSDNSTKSSELISSTTESDAKENKTKPFRKVFTEKRFKVQHPHDGSDWDESDTSIDKNIEPEKTLNNKELLKKVINEGASSILKPGKPSKKVHSKNAENAEGVDEITDMDAEEKGEIEENGGSVEIAIQQSNETPEKASLEEVDPGALDGKSQKRNKHKSQRSHTKQVPKTVELTKLNKEFYAERRWPDGAVIYVIKELPDYDLKDLRKRLAKVNSILTEKTCVKLREVDAKEAPGFDDYIILDDSPDYVTGRVGGKQNFGCIELFEGGHHTQHTAMMVMALLGFYFEVARHDRDKHIRVHNRHIRPDKLHHFEKIQSEATLNLPYDYKSATHPAWQFWRKIGKKGISTIATYKEHDPDGTIMRSLGQNSELLSEYDIIKINSIYGIECFQSNRASSKDKNIERMETEEDVIQ